MDTLLFIAALILFVSPLLSYAFFLYETANSDYLAQLEEMSQGRARRWILQGILTSFLAQLPIIFLYPFVFWRKLHSTLPADPTSPFPSVIFVHGLYHNAGGWLFYRFWFKRAGFTNTYTWTYNSFKYSFAELLEQLDQWIKEVADHSPHKEVILVGHSLGGLLVRAYVEGPVQRGKVTAAVALGAPHQGCKMYVFSLGSLGRSLKYRGPLVLRIEKETAPSQVPCLNLYSPVDNIVLPPEALMVPHGGWIHRQCAPVSHTAMLYHRGTAQQIVEFLKDICKSHPGCKA